MSFVSVILVLGGILLYVYTNNSVYTVHGVMKSEVYYSLILLSAFLVLSGLYDIVNQLIKKERKESALLPMNTKKCPACAELIKIEARVCKHCGYKFSEDELMKQNEEREYAHKGFPPYRILEIADDYQYNQSNFSMAIYYLEKLLREYPEVEYTDMVKKRLEEIKNKVS